MIFDVVVLDEVVIVGYGFWKKLDFIGVVSFILGEELRIFLMINFD